MCVVFNEGERIVQEVISKKKFHIQKCRVLLLQILIYNKFKKVPNFSLNFDDENETASFELQFK